MLRNYLTTSLRNLLRYKSYSAINVLGLTIGLTTSIFMFMWVMDELAFDRFHAKKDRIYRVMSNHIYPEGKIETYPATTMLLAGAMKAELPEIDQVVQLSWETDMLIKFGVKAFSESGFYGDSTLFSIFSFPIVRGDGAHPLPNRKSITLSQTVARKLFGEEDPIGKSVEVNHSYYLTVTSVFADVPRNSTLQFDYVVSFELFEQENPWAKHWRAGGMQTLLTLKEGADLEAANVKVKDLITRNCKDCTSHPFLYKYSNVHLYNVFSNGRNDGGRIQQIWLFSGIAAIILIIACINFMNLATARSATRGREVGVRKSIGALQSGIIMQFLIESVMLSLCALVLALALVELLLPLFNEITSKQIHTRFLDPAFVAGLAVITLTSGLLAGSYPAIFLSSFKPAIVLKGNAQSALSGTSIRKALVTIQFMTSMVLIVGSIVVHDQIKFISTKNLGFHKENVMVIQQREGVMRNREAFKNELLQHAFVKGVGFGGSELSTIPITTRDPVWPGKDDASISFKIFRCDEDFIPTMGMNIVAGRNFSHVGRLDSANYIINLKAMEAMGLTLENVIGTDLEMWNGKGKIIGLTNDFNNGSLREGIEPLIFMYSTNIGSFYYIRLDGNTDVQHAVAGIESTVKKYDPDYSFQYSFLDEMLGREYRTESVIGKLSLCFTVVAVLVSCLGLYGLSSFTAERRLKELGVRKVLGASTFDLIALLCSDFTQLVALAILLASPVAWYITHNYLSGYAYHAEPGIWVFAGPALGMLLLTLITVGQQSLKAAIGNPVDSLRNE